MQLRLLLINSAIKMSIKNKWSKNGNQIKNHALMEIKKQVYIKKDKVELNKI
jgi:hypothetical protein